MQICCFLVSVKSRIQQARVSHFPRFFCTRCSSWIAERWAFLISSRRAARIPKNVPFISSTPHVSAPPLPTLLPIPLTFSSRSGSVAATPDKAQGELRTLIRMRFLWMKHLMNTLCQIPFSVLVWFIHTSEQGDILYLMGAPLHNLLAYPPILIAV